MLPMERPLAAKRANRPADPRRHGCSVAARSQGDPISLLVVIGVRRGLPKGAARRQGHGRGDNEAWRQFSTTSSPGACAAEFLIVDGAPGLDEALAAVWDGVPIQRCTVHKHRNLLAHAPERLHEKISADYTDMIYAATAAEIEERRKAFLRKWRLRYRAVAESLEEAGDKLFAFTRLRRASGRAPAQPTPLNACTRSSSAGSRPRRSCPRQRRPRCCSGRCSRQARS